MSVLHLNINCILINVFQNQLVGLNFFEIVLEFFLEQEILMLIYCLFSHLNTAVEFMFVRALCCPAGCGVYSVAGNEEANKRSKSPRLTEDAEHCQGVW